MERKIVHDRDHNRFITRTEHGEARLEYACVDATTLDYRSTVVPERDRGRGIGEALVRHALQWAGENGFQVIPSCPFVRRVLENRRERSGVSGE